MTQVPRNFRSVGDVFAAIELFDLPLHVKQTLRDLAQHAGPGPWSRHRRAVVTPRGDSLQTVFDRIAPMRTRHAQSRDYVRQMQRGCPPNPMVHERADRPSTPGELWALIAHILRLWPQRENVQGASGASVADARDR